jgi:crossover junction endodeoxyribonuclease RuvC
MIILGIDPGLATMGYGVVETQKGQPRVLDFGVVSTKKSLSLPLRLIELEREVGALIDKYAPDQIAVEELFFTKNISTGIPVAEARGVILLTCVKKTQEVYEYTPNQIKQAITGSGNADKRQVQTMVQLLLNLKTKPSPDDAADALAVAICHSQVGRLCGEFRVK